MALEEDMISEFKLEDDRASWGSECLSMIPVVNVLVQSTTNVSFWTMTIDSIVRQWGTFTAPLQLATLPLLTKYLFKTVNLTPEHLLRSKTIL